MSAGADYAAELCRLAVAVTLAGAVIGKARALRDFEEAIGALFGLARRRLRSAAVAVIAVEGLIAAALAGGGAWARAGMAAAAGLFLLFGAVLLLALVQGKAVRCNCFGGQAHPISALDLIRNAALIAACAFYLLAAAGPLLEPPAFLGLAAIGVVLFLAAGRLFGSGGDSTAFTLPVGDALPPFEGRRSDGSPIGLADLAGRPAVLVFLSAGCATCRGKIGELVRILPGARNSGVRLWVVGDDAKGGIAPLIAGTPLIDRLLRLDAATRRRMNPRHTAPFYIFIDQELVVQASSYIGDEDWLSFVEQMHDFAPAEEAAQ